VRSRTYEITFGGQAGAATCAEFDDCRVTIGPETTTLRCELPDQAALAGLIQRIIGLRLEITNVLLVEPAAAPLLIPAQITNPAQLVAHSEGNATQVTFRRDCDPDHTVTRDL
jgi:hypothetical protein